MNPKYTQYYFAESYWKNEERSKKIWYYQAGQAKTNRKLMLLIYSPATNQRSWAAT